jgi:hypothetical protein
MARAVRVYVECAAVLTQSGVLGEVEREGPAKAGDWAGKAVLGGQRGKAVA